MPRKRPRAVSDSERGAADDQTGRDQSSLSWLAASLIVFVGFTLAYAIAFYRADAFADGFRRKALDFVAAPDQLFVLWCGGEKGRFSLLDRWPLAILSAIVLTSAWLAGRLALRLLGVTAVLDRLERAVFALGVGLNLLSLYALTVGLAGGLQLRWLFVLPLAALVAANVAIEWLQQRADANSPPAVERNSDLDDRRWLGWLVPAVPWAAVIVLAGMLPPVAYDVREYHLQAPKEWFQNGRIDFLPHNIYANMPLGSELTSLWAMALVGGRDGWWWGAVAGKTVMACYSLVTAAALVAFGRRIHSLAAGVIAAATFLSTPWVVWLSSAGYNEGPVAMYALLSIFAVWLAAQAKGDKTADRLAVLAGFCAGSAVACKYPPLLFLVVPLAIWVGGIGWLAGRIWRRVASAGDETPPDAEFPWRKTATATVIFIAAAAVGCGLWFGKNLALTGNPTYPLLYRLFDGRTRTPEKDRQWTRVHAPQPDQQGRRFSLSELEEKATWLAWKAPWNSVTIVPLALAAWLAPQSRRLVAALMLWMLFVFFAWWLLTHRLDRFLILLLPAGALLAGIGAMALPHLAWRIATLALVTWGLVMQFPVATIPADNRYFAPLEALRRDDPTLNYGGDAVHPAHLWLNAHRDTVQRVLLVGDAEPFDLEVPTTYNTCFDDCQFARLFQGRTREECLAALRAEGITHVFFHWTHLARYRSPGNYGYTSDYVTPELIHDELVGQQHLLKKIELGLKSWEGGELYEVDQPTSAAASNAKVQTR